MRAYATALRIAQTQFGVATRRQLLAQGVTAHQIDHLRETGALVTVHRGVDIIAGSPASVEQTAMAACLSCGDGAMASFATAAAVIGVAKPPDVPEVTVPHASRPRSTAIRTHRTTVLGPLHVGRRGPLSMTTPARTLADLASRTDGVALTLMTDEVLRRRMISATALRRYLDLPAISVFPGTRTLRDIVDDRIAHGLPDRAFEALMIDLMTEYELPGPVRQYRTTATGRPVRFDLCYPDRGVVIELDGWDPHSSRQQWEADHERHNAIELAGWRRLGFTWDHVNHRRPYVAVTVGEILGLCPKGWVAAKASRVAQRQRSDGRLGTSGTP